MHPLHSVAISHGSGYENCLISPNFLCMHAYLVLDPGQSEVTLKRLLKEPCKTALVTRMHPLYLSPECHSVLYCFGIFFALLADKFSSYYVQFQQDEE